MDDLISRQAAIDAMKDVLLDEELSYAIPTLEKLPSAQPEPSTEIQEILNYLDTTLHPIVSPDNWNVYAELHDMVSRLPSAQPEQNNASEFWRKRADFYSDMCMNLIGEMGKGVKVESVKISENGIEFIKKQPSAQSEIVRCKDCKYFNSYFVDCDRESGLRHIKDDNDYCSYAERREA